MDEVKHTPPTLEWRYVPSHIAEGPSEVRHVDGWLVCETCSDDYARLIAAAPIMLASLQQLSNAVSNMRVPQNEAEAGAQVMLTLGPALEAAQDAIAKAEGRS